VKWRDHLRWLRARPRLSFVIATLLVLWSMVDFFTGTWVGRDRSLREFKSPTPVDIPSIPAADSVNAVIDSWFPLVAASEKAPPPRDIVLQGIFRSEGSTMAILLLRASESQPEERRRLAIGDTVEGELVESIDTRRIVLAKDGRTRELVLLRGKP
jgi:hypothetical protein